MYSVDLEVLHTSAKWLEQGLRVTLVTVVKTFGSSPRPPGAMLAVCEDGRLVGSVSGGCIEDDLIARLRRGESPVERPEVVTYGITSEEARRFGLPCGGTLQLVLEPLRDAAAIDRLLEAVERREVIARRLVIESGDVTIAPADPGQEVDFDGAVLTTIHGPRWRLGIIGAGQMSVYLAQMAQALDYHVMVCDPREEYRASWDMPGVELSTEMPDDFVTSMKPDVHTAIIALTHDPKQDDLALLEALKSAAFYVGAIGSKSNQEKRRERLATFDLTPEQLARLHGPVGLQIGGKTPPEMAVAILGHLTAVRNGIELKPVQKKGAQDAARSPAAQAVTV